MASMSGPRGARLSLLRRLTPTQRIVLMPVVAAVAFLILFTLNWRGSIRSEELVTRIGTGYVPALELAVGLNQSLALLQRALQDAVAASDADDLLEADAAKEDMVRQLEAGQRNPALDALALKELEANVQDYYALARPTTIAMLQRRLGVDLTDSLGRMTKGYNDLKARLDALLTRQKEEMRSAFTSTQAAQRTSARLFGAVILVCLVFLVGLSVVIGRSQELTAAAYRESEELLLKSQKMLQEAQRTAHIGSWDWDLVTNEVVWSEEFHRIIGRDPESFRPSVQAFLDAVHPEDREAVQAQIEAWIRTGDRSDFVLRIVRQDGDVRSLFTSGSVVLGQTGKAARIFGTCQDVTEQRRLEEQLRQSQKMEAVGRLAGGVAHDFNNLLTVIQGYADLLRNDSGAGEGEERTEAIEQIRIASKRAAALTGQLLAFSRQQVLQPKILELNAVVSNLAPMLRRVIGEDITLVTNLDPRGESVLADAGQLEQVIMNLVVNSRDAMPQGGTLTVETGSVDVAELPGIELETPPGRYARLTVKDTGTGLSPQVQARVFEPFFTTKEVGKGTGLGLATVYGIVKQSGGFVQLHSELGHGATFNVYFPCTEGEVRQVEPVSGIRQVLPSEKIILLIEDEDAVRKLLFSVLSGHGYTVLQAASGQEALAVASGHAGPIDLVLSDVVMPGTGGPETVAELQRSRPTSQVIFMSGYTDDSVVRHGLTDSGRYFIQKPFTPVTLLKKVNEVLKG
jgi:two-component system cell cycle sensor histidine kinase/response regulator CckA